MRKWLIIAVWFTGVSVRYAGEQHTRVVFGVRIAMTANSQMTSFIALRFDEGGFLREKRAYSKDDFIRIASGFWPSVFNPKRINYFEQEHVFGGVYVNDTIQAKIPYCPGMDSLWKIRFSDYPFRSGFEKGWSGGLYKPTLAQQKYLVSRYAVGHIDQDYFVDTSFWKLMRDVSDTTWIGHYKAIR